MKSIFFMTSLFMTSGLAFAWDFSAKGDFQRFNTTNVNLTDTAPIADTVNAVSGYLQTKNEKYRLRLKGKKEQYTKEVANDNYSVDLSLQYKRTKSDEYIFSVFKQVYNGSTIVSTDTTSDNQGGKVSATFSKEFSAESSGYISPTITSKTYPKISNRTDKIYAGTLGFEHYFTQNFMVNPELNLQKNSSSDSYYENSSWGVMVALSYTIEDNWEFFADAGYSATEYQGRTITSTGARGRSSVEYENQKLTSADLGVSYNFEKYVSLQLKFGTESNTSNSSSSEYKVNTTSFNIGLKF